MQEQNSKRASDNGTSASILILSITGIGAVVFGLWLWEIFVMVTK